MALTVHWSRLSWLCLLLTGIIIASVHPILINLGKVNGEIPFSSASVALMIELFKLLTSIGFVLKDVYFYQNIQIPQRKTFMLYSVPAILYTINNNLVTHIQKYTDPASFQILNNLKIAATAICYKIIINRTVSRRKWIAVCLLFAAGIVNSLGGLRSEVDSSAVNNELYITRTGIYLILVYCCLSGMANVYTEMILKKYYKTSVHLQNLILYSFGIGMNALMFSVGNNSYASETTNFLHGFSKWTWLIVVSQAVNGIIISLVLKKSSNITRLFMVGSSMVLTSIFSFFIFNYVIGVYFFASFVLILFALFLYHEPQIDTSKSLS